MQYDVFGNSELDYEQVEVNSERWLSLDNLKNETWEDIEGYEGLYQVSNYGRVKSLGHKPRYKNIGDRILRQGKNDSYYWLVVLYKNKTKSTRKVHILVADAFIPKDIDKLFIDHYYPVVKDKCNNCLYNLRRVTMKENVQHSIELGRFKKPPIYNKTGRNHCQSKPVIQFDLFGNFIKQWYCIADLKKEFGYNHSCISNCCKGKTRKAYGYKWKYGIYEEGGDIRT